MARPDYRRVQSLNNVLDSSFKSESGMDGEQNGEKHQHPYRHTIYISPHQRGGRIRYGRSGSARSIRIPPPLRGIDSDTSEASLELPLDAAKDNGAGGGVALHSHNSDSGPTLVSSRNRNGWNQRKSHSASALNTKGNLDSSGHAPLSPHVQSMRGARKMYKGRAAALSQATFCRKDSAGNNSISSLSLLEDSTTQVHDSLTSIGSAFTIPTGPAQVLAPGNSELRWTACSSQHRHNELSPTHVLTPPNRPQPRLPTSGSTESSDMEIPPPLTDDDDDDTGEFAESSTVDTLDDIVIVDDRLRSSQHEIPNNEEETEPAKSDSPVIVKKPWKVKRIISVDSFNKKQDGLLKNESYDTDSSIQAASKNDTTLSGKSENNDDSTQATKQTDRMPATASYCPNNINSTDSSKENEVNSQDSGLNRNEPDIEGLTDKESGHKMENEDHINFESQTCDRHKNQVRSWKAKRVISAESFNKKLSQRTEAPDQTDPPDEAEKESNGTPESDSPRPKTRSWTAKRILSVESFNNKLSSSDGETSPDRNQPVVHNEQIETNDAETMETVTGTSQSPQPKAKPWKIKRVMSADSFKKQEEQTHGDAVDLPLDKKFALEGPFLTEQADTSAISQSKKPYWKPKRVISVESFNRKLELDANSSTKRGTSHSDAVGEEDEAPTIECVGDERQIDNQIKEKTLRKPKESICAYSGQVKASSSCSTDDDGCTEPETTEEHTESSGNGDSLEAAHRGWKVKRIISVDSFRKEKESEFHESLHSGQDTLESQAEQASMASPTKPVHERKSLSPPGEATTEPSRPTRHRIFNMLSSPVDTSTAKSTTTVDALGYENAENVVGYSKSEQMSDASLNEPKRRGSTGAMAYSWDNITKPPETGDEAPSPSTPTPRRRAKRRGSTGALVSLFENKAKPREEKPPEEETSSRRGRRTVLVDLWEEMQQKDKQEEEYVPENSSRRGPRTALAKKWSEELLPMITKPSTPDHASRKATAMPASKNEHPPGGKSIADKIPNTAQEGKDKTSASEISQTLSTEIDRNIRSDLDKNALESDVEAEDSDDSRTKPKRRGSAGVLARKWSEEIIPKMIKGEGDDCLGRAVELSTKEAMAKKRELRRKARAGKVAVDKKSKLTSDKPTQVPNPTTMQASHIPDEKVVRKQRIKQELARLISHAEKFELMDSIEFEIRSALKKAALELAYKKKYYDVFKDEFVYLPTIAHTMLNYTLFEKAEELFGQEDDMLPIHYVAALFSTAEYEVSKYIDDLDFGCMERLAMDIEWSADGNDNIKKSDMKHPGSESPRAILEELPRKAEVSPKEGLLSKTTSKVEKGNSKIKREIVKVKSESSLRPSPKKNKKFLSTSAHLRDSGTKQKSLKKAKKAEFQRSNSTGTLDTGDRYESKGSPLNRDELSQLLPPKRNKLAENGVSQSEDKPKERSRSKSRDRKELKSRARSKSNNEKRKSRARSKSAGRVAEKAEKKKSRGRSKSAGRVAEADSKKKAREKALSASLVSSEEKKSTKPRGRSRSLDPMPDSKKQSSSKGMDDSKKRSSSKGPVDSKTKKRSSSVGVVERKQSATKRKASIESSSDQNDDTTPGHDSKLKKKVTKSKPSAPTDKFLSSSERHTPRPSVTSDKFLSSSEPHRPKNSLVSTKTKSKRKLGSNSPKKAKYKSKPTISSNVGLSASMRIILGQT